MSTSRKLEWIRVPQQARSRETLERLLDAAESVIAEKGVEGASVAEIARRADSSIGAFYARFHDKEGLLQYLFERFDEQALATARAALEPARWEGISLRLAFETVLRFLLEVLHEKRGLLGAMLARMPTSPSVGLLGERTLGHVAEFVLTLIESRGATSTRPDLERSVRTATWVVLGALELRAVGAIRSPDRLGDDALSVELAELCMGYLGIEEAPSRARAHKRPSARRRARAAIRQPTEQP